MLLGYDDEEIEKIENMSTAETKNFTRQFLDFYILGNEDIVRLFYDFYYHNSKAFRTRILFLLLGLMVPWQTVLPFLILNHFHLDKLNETLENGPSAQKCSPAVKYVIVFVKVIVKLPTDWWKQFIITIILSVFYGLFSVIFELVLAGLWNLVNALYWSTFSGAVSVLS